MQDPSAAALCRLVLNFRLVTLFITVVYLPTRDEDFPFLIGALVAAALVGFLTLRGWERIGPVIARHPSLLFVDLLFSLAILLFAGPESPFFYFTLGTALLSGILYGLPGALLFSALLAGGYWGVLSIRAEVVEGLDGFQLLAGNPLLYPLAALAGVALQALLDRQAATEKALASVREERATAQERARIAREMHDRLAKTVNGIALGAAALARLAEREPARVAAEARQLQASAQQAAIEARQLLHGLRSDAVEMALGEAMWLATAEWTRQTGIPIDAEIPELDLPSPAVRHELLSILSEALANVERHAGASAVSVSLREDAGQLRLVVADDGGGMPPPSERDAASANGHYGLLGMGERAERIGGRVHVESPPGGGTRVVLTAPLATAGNVGALRPAGSEVSQ